VPGAFGRRPAPKKVPVIRTVQGSQPLTFSHSILRRSIFSSLILVYLGFEVREILVPPQIEILNPGDGFSTDQAIVSITGRVFERADVLINGEKVLLDKNGTFIADIDLEQGMNLITIEAKKRYSKISTVHRRIILENEISDKLTKY